MNPLYRNDAQGSFPPSWYVASTDLPAPRKPLDGDRNVDVVILGAGYCGLWAAKTAAEAGLRPLVIEAHRVGFGASGRNGGQAASIYNKDMMWLEKRLGNDTARQLFDLAEDGLSQLKDFCRLHAPDARFKPGVAFGAWSESDLNDLKVETEYLSETYNMETQFFDADAFRDIVRSPKYVGGLIDNRAGHIHPLRYCLALAREAETAGAEIVEMTEVTRIKPGAKVVFETPTGNVTADFGIIAGNGYLPNLHPKISARTMPINSFIAATEPLGDRAKTVLSEDIAVADDRFVVNYFRLSEDKRLLFGGRENYSLGYPKDIGTRLRERLETMFPQIAGIGIDYTWGGTLGITTHRLPFVTRIGTNLMSAGGFSGHGVVLSGIAGRVMGEAVTGQASRLDVMSQLPCPAFPGGATFRAPILTLAMTWFSLRDRLGI